MSGTELVAGGGGRPPSAQKRTPRNGRVRRSSPPDDGLSVALGALSLLSAGSMALSDFAVQVSSLLSTAIADADGAAITVYHSDRASTTAADCAFARKIDALHYELGEGPCISATAERASKHSGALASDQRWPRFGPRARTLGAHSALALPLVSDTVLVGVLSLYSREQNAFDQDAVGAGERYALAAAASIQTAEALASAIRIVDELKAARRKRVAVDQAVGIIIGRSGSAPGLAFEQLRLLSQRDHRTLYDVAQRLIDQSVAGIGTPSM